MKVGDIIVSRVHYPGKFTEGKSYLIISNRDYGNDIITIRTDSGEEHSFYVSCMRDYFYTGREVRKMKLNKIVDTNEED